MSVQRALAFKSFEANATADAFFSVHCIQMSLQISSAFWRVGTQFAVEILFELFYEISQTIGFSDDL